MRFRILAALVAIAVVIFLLWAQAANEEISNVLGL